MARILSFRFAIGMLVLGAAVVPGCNCSSKGTSVIVCTMDTECPPPLTCDEMNGYCVDPNAGDAGPYGCQPPLPGCPCESGRPSVQCTLDGQDPNVIGSCREGNALCEMGVYGECTEVPNPNCESVGVGGPGAFDP